MQAAARIDPTPGPSLGLHDPAGLFAANVGLVRAVAAAFASRLPSGVVDADDLTQAGMLALHVASEEWRESCGVKFGVFARRRIKAAICEALEVTAAGVRVGRAARKEARAFRAVAARIRERTGYEPDARTVAKTMGLTGPRSERVRGAAAVLASAAVDNPRVIDGAESRGSEGATLDARDALAFGLGTLDADELHAVYLRVGMDGCGERKPSDVAEMMGISAGHVTKLYRRSMEKLRAAMGGMR